MKRVALLLVLSGCAVTQTAEQASTITEVNTEVRSTCEPFDWPVVAAISSGFGARDSDTHQGIDLPVAEGTPVLAACDGIVRYADDKQRGYGRMVIVEHADGRSTLYAHNSELVVHAGERVARGQLLARSGQTGRASAPHVHFELREPGGKPIDPVPHLATSLSLVSR